jgi:rhamnosyltransferase
LRAINTNAALTSILPDVRLRANDKKEKWLRVAVCVHMYYTDMLEEIISLIETIPCDFDFIATTESLDKKVLIEKSIAGSGKVANVIVRVVEQNRGRDMSALFITCRDLFLEDRYDLVCRLHTKKSPQVWAARANMFKRHMFENLLSSPGFTANVLDLFKDGPTIGVAVPPLIHIAYPTMGHVWFVNRERVEMLARDLDIRVQLDPDTPVGAFGGMFWFRPKALRKLFLHPWKWEDFHGEPYPHDGSLGHALERLICYVAQDAGYTTQQIVSSHQAAWTYAMLEYKLQKLASKLPFADFRDQVSFLDEWKKADYRPSRMNVNMRLIAGQVPTIREALVDVVLAVRRSFVHRFPGVAGILRPIYQRLKKTVSKTDGFKKP